MYPELNLSDSKPVIFFPTIKPWIELKHVLFALKEVIEKVIRENNAVIKATLRSEIGENLNTHIRIM